MEIAPNRAFRDSGLYLFAGFPGTGKSSLIEKFIEIEVQKRKGRVLIVTPDPFDWKQYPELDVDQPDCFSNIRSPHRIIYEPGVIEKIADYTTGFFDGLIAFDDCRCYTKANIQESLRKLIIRRRHRSHDIIAAGHGFTEIPPVFFTYANKYVIFYTQDSIERRKEEIGNSNFDAVKQAVEDVNSMYNKDPHFFKCIHAKKINQV